MPVGFGPPSLTFRILKVDEKWQANTGGSGFSGGFLFDFNPKPVTQDNFFFDPLSNKQAEQCCGYTQFYSS